jgi:hypothetical protein
MGLLERFHAWREDRERHSEEDLEAELRGEVTDPRTGKRDRRGDGIGPEEEPFAADVGLRGPRGDMGP